MHLLVADVSVNGGPATRTVRDEGPMLLGRVLRVLRVLADEPDGTTLAELHVRLGVPKTSMHALLRALFTEGYVQRFDARYRLGAESFALGSALIAARTLGIVATPFLQDARAKSGETVLIASIDRSAGRLTYTQVVESHKPVRYTVPAGTTRPLFASSAGRVLLAFQPEAWTHEYLRTTDRRKMTESTVTDRRQLLRLIERIRVEGHATTVGEVTPDVAGFAAPIFDADGRVDAALIIAAPIERGRAAAERLTGVSIETARDLSRALGHRPAGLPLPIARTERNP
ncbi:MAG TPA: IclR family transcriptional regulator [Rubrivivax sp.]|nr:IclR family transcriptional regulator [Rubrivivax sp.]